MSSAAEYFRPLPDELKQVQTQFEQLARHYGLDFFPTSFEVVDWDQLNAIAAYGGFPTRYPHWRFGMEYEQLAKAYSYGLQKIYELVINNNPCYAYLLKSNDFSDHKLVIAHVVGHCDFFKNNFWFSATNRKMIDEIANHGNRVRRYIDRFGQENVESFIDVCLSIEDLIDIHSPFIKRYDERARYDFSPADEPAPVSEPSGGRFDAKPYLESFVNPRAAIENEARRAQQSREQRRKFPPEPVRDVMLFVLEHAPLEPWQADVLAIVRDEAYYFAPQAQTKIMNEGWATYWHSAIMTRHGLTDGEVINYADHCAATLAGSRTQLNPYKLGLELYRNIEDRWNRGQFGDEWENCDDADEKANWNNHAQRGREKIFEVRKIHNDLTFVDEFLTYDFCRDHKLFQFGFNQAQDTYEIESRAFSKVKRQLLFNLTNLGRPLIYVRDGNYKNRGELFLEHRYNGVELKLPWARDTLANLYRLWARPVHLETVVDEFITILSFDGQNQHQEKTDKKSDFQPDEDAPD